MRGIYSSVTDIRRKVFTEVARLAYEGGDYSRIEELPYKILPGEAATYRESIFLERAIVGERLRLAIGLPLRPIDEHSLVSDGIVESAKTALANGIPVGLGNDVGCPYITQYDFWRELCYFHKYCGVSNQFALYTATLRNARLAGVGDVTGSLEVGKDADIAIADGRIRTNSGTSGPGDGGIAPSPYDYEHTEPDMPAIFQTDSIR